MTLTFEIQNDVTYAPLKQVRIKDLARHFKLTDRPPGMVHTRDSVRGRGIVRIRVHDIPEDTPHRYIAELLIYPFMIHMTAYEYGWEALKRLSSACRFAHKYGNYEALKEILSDVVE